MQRTVCSVERRDAWLQGHHYDRRQTRFAAPGAPPGARRRDRRAPLGPVSEQEQQQHDDGDDERDDRDGPGIHENVPSFCGHPYRRPRSRSIATMPDAQADRAPMWDRTATSLPSSSRPLFIYASGAGALLPFAEGVAESCRVEWWVSASARIVGVWWPIGCQPVGVPFAVGAASQPVASWSSPASVDRG